MGRTDEATRLIDASPVRVYKALLNPDALVRWLPPTGMTGRMERFDPKVGGDYRMVLTYEDASSASGKSSAAEDVVVGTFVTIEPGVRVVQNVEFVSDDPQYAGVMTMTWEVRAEGMGTWAAFRAENVPPGIRAEDHVAGMNASLENLAEFVAA